VVLGGVLAMAGVWFLSEGDEPPTSGVRPAGAPETTAGSASGDTATTTIDVEALSSTDVFVVAPGSGGVTGVGDLHTYTVEVEQGVPVDPRTFAAEVEAILDDPRGWTAAGDVALQRVGSDAAPMFRVRLATPSTTDAHCAPLLTEGEVSCRNGEDVMINVVRWLAGAAPSKLPLAQYRQYVISHEVGHALGHEHEGCPGRGAIAPVMLQQTEGLQGCTPNPWPVPDAG
jgi:hypothetical protein